VRWAAARGWPAWTTDAAGSTAINGGEVLTSGAQTYGDPVTLGASVSLGSSAGSIGFDGTLDAAVAGVNLTLTATAGDINFTGSVGSAAPALQSLTITTAHAVTFAGTVATAGDLTQAAGTSTTTLNGGSVGGNLSLAASRLVLNSGRLAVTNRTDLDRGRRGRQRAERCGLDHDRPAAPGFWNVHPLSAGQHGGDGGCERARAGVLS